MSWGRALGIRWVGSREAAPCPHGTQDTPTEDAVSRGHCGASACFLGRQGLQGLALLLLLSACGVAALQHQLCVLWGLVGCWLHCLPTRVISPPQQRGFRLSSPQIFRAEVTLKSSLRKPQPSQHWGCLASGRPTPGTRLVWLLLLTWQLR